MRRRLTTSRPMPLRPVPLRFVVLAAVLLLAASCSTRQPAPTARACLPSGPAVSAQQNSSYNQQPGQVLREHILDVAQPVIGTRYRYGGTTPKGFDCSGFTRFVYEQFGLNLPHGSRSQVLQGSPVERDELRPGDLVFFDIRGRGRVSHVGIYLGDSRMVHASIQKGVAIDSLHDPYYNRRYYAARRIPQLAAELFAILSPRSAEAKKN